MNDRRIPLLSGEQRRDIALLIIHLFLLHHKPVGIERMLFLELADIVTVLRVPHSADPTCQVICCIAVGILRIFQGICLRADSTAARIDGFERFVDG